MIEIKGLTKSFGELEVLKGIDLQIEDGETVAIIGPSGSGKSTFLRCLNLLELPQNGEVTIGNHYYNATSVDKKKFLEIRRATAMVFQNYCLFENKTVIKNITLPLTAVKKIPEKEAVEQAKKLLERVGLLDKQNAFPSQLSGGQQQRISIARALALKPEVILFDEPTSALDPELVQEVLDVIKAVAQENITTIIVTHEMTFARDVADRVVFMADGEIVEMGEAKQVISSPNHDRTKKFLQHFLKSSLCV